MLRRTLISGSAVLMILASCGRSQSSPEQQEVVLPPIAYESAESAIAVGVVSTDGLPKGSVWVRLSEGDNSPASYGYMCDDKPVGFWTYRYANAQVQMQGRYLYGGNKDGVWNMWHDNGRRMAQGAFDRGEPIGEWQQWHSGGARSTRGSYLLGQRSGVWTSWWPNGKLMSQGVFVDGRPSGRWMYWDKNGVAMPNHTHSHPGVAFPDTMNPAQVGWDGQTPLP